MNTFITEKYVKELLTNMGFDFSLIGTLYLKEALMIVVKQPKSLLSINTTVLEDIAFKNNNTVKNIESDIKWTIMKAYEKGDIKDFSYLPYNKVPTTKQMIVCLFDFIMD